MLDKLDGRAPQQDGVQPLPPVTEITPPKPGAAGEGNGTAKEKKEGDDSTNDGDSTQAEGNGASAATSMSNTIGQLQVMYM